MDELLCPCLVVIPLDYNPNKQGSIVEVEPEVMGEIISWLNRQFEGWRPVSMAGVGQMPSGSWRGQSDRSLTVVVALSEKRTPEWIEFVRAVGLKLKQKAMYYEIGPPIARIMFLEADDIKDEDDSAACSS